MDKSKEGTKAFLATLVVLILLVVAYAYFHVATFQRYRYMHYEAADVTGDRQDLLITVAVLEDQLKTPTAIAAPAVQVLFHDLEQSVLRAETSKDVTELFDTAAKELAKLGIQEDASDKILEAARAKADEFVSAPEGEQEEPRQLSQVELKMAQAWALDTLGVPAMLDRVEQLNKAAEGLGYDDDSEVGKALAGIVQELETDRPNRRLIAEMLSQVGDEIRGPRQSLFWSHPILRWLEVMAWSLAGMLVVRLWVIGRFIGREDFQAKWNWWWVAKIVQAPLLAIAVVLVLSYFELALRSGATFGFTISLRDQPIELVVAISFILGLYSDRAYQFLQNLADKVLELPETTEELPGKIAVQPSTLMLSLESKSNSSHTLPRM